MHSQSVAAVVVGALAVMASAKGNEKAAGNSTTTQEGNQTLAACHQIAALTFLSDIANNQTESAAFISHSKNATKAQDELTAASTQLKTMSTNATLMATCGVVNAHDMFVGQCLEMQGLQKLSAINSNATAKQELISKSKNQTQIQDLLAAAPAKLSAMTANTTIASQCPVVNANTDLQISCAQMKSLQKLSDASTNATAKQDLLSKAKNQTKIEDMIAAAPAKLKEMTSNTTLVSSCDAISKAKASGTDGSNKGTGSLSTSSAESVAIGKVAVGLLAAVALGAVTLF